MNCGENEMMVTAIMVAWHERPTEVALARDAQSGTAHLSPAYAHGQLVACSTGSTVVGCLHANRLVMLPNTDA
jgi:hypothetical protein